MGIYNWLTNKMTQWLIYEEKIDGSAQCDFDRLSFEIRPCDVLLIEGRSRVSRIIKNVTQSPWTHSALYIGRIHELENESDRALLEKHYQGDPSEQLIIEALLGEGTIIIPLKKYYKDHIRICRPKGLTRQDSTNVIAHALHHVGGDYNVRQLFDLARFLLPYGILPRRWRSSLFERENVGKTTQTVCSSMIASAFSSVQFPILPVVHQNSDGGLRMFKRNTRLYIPPDFDYSPYFEIIKYAIMGFDDLAIYRQLPWDQNGVICNDENDCYIPSPQIDLEQTSNIEAEVGTKKISNDSTSTIPGGSIEDKSEQRTEQTVMPNDEISVDTIVDKEAVDKETNQNMK
ncbi:MAG: hypothetical protein GXP19_03430 [Gammaproteobacteria bacterium]|nr:hypothetical protein [Gammaproteobacteria bacterium]